MYAESMIYIFAALAVWRITYAIQTEAGPWDVLIKFRWLFFDGGDIEGRPKGDFFPSLMSCFYCLSCWVAIPFALYLSWGEWWTLPIYIFGLSAGAILMNIIHEKLTKEEQHVQ